MLLNRLGRNSFAVHEMRHEKPRSVGLLGLGTDAHNCRTAPFPDWARLTFRCNHTSLSGSVHHGIALLRLQPGELFLSPAAPLCSPTLPHHLAPFLALQQWSGSGDRVHVGKKWRDQRQASSYRTSLSINRAVFHMIQFGGRVSIAPTLQAVLYRFLVP